LVATVTWLRCPAGIRCKNRPRRSSLTPSPYEGAVSKYRMPTSNADSSRAMASARRAPAPACGPGFADADQTKTELHAAMAHRYIIICMIAREQAWNILCEFTKSEGLRKHALAVETCVVAYAAKLGEDQHAWSVTALLHDFDWEIHPQLPDHPIKGEPILAERGVDEETRRAILSHANHSGVPRLSPLEKTLYACDELAGFITAISYVKPHRSVFEVDVASVKKKMKDKAFARSVNRQEIVDGAQELGVPLDDHIDFCVKAMQARAEELGLKGSL